MSKGTWVFIGFIGLAAVALLTQLPGTPGWRLLNPTITVTVTSPREGAEPTEIKIVSVLARDAIDAILDPTFVSGDGTTMRDAPTGSLWSAAQGVALEGVQLAQLPSFVSFWFSWSDFYPQTSVYQPGDTPGT